MSPKKNRCSSSDKILALPPISYDFASNHTPEQAIAVIRQLGAQLTLNRCQAKRITAACESVYRRPARSEQAERMLINVYIRCQIWRSADLLQKLVVLPDDMDKFEKQLNQLGARQSSAPSLDDKNSENEAIALAVQQILSNEPDRSRAVTLRGHPAELFASHVQNTLDISSTMKPNLREECIKALRKLAVEAEVLPSGLKIEEVTFTGKNPIAQGGFSDVYQGKWKGKLVAVKRPRLFSTGDNSEMLKQTRREMLLWRQLRHDHVLLLLGIFEEGRSLDSMVSEWMTNGTLKTFLENPEHRCRNRLNLMYQISSALEYLHTHSPPIAHGDIKAGNIFVDNKFRPVLGDFGLSCIRYTIDRTMSSTLDAGSARWMAPELLLPDESSKGCYAKPSLESDIWAFAMLMLEMFTDEKPYSKELDPLVIWLITKEHKIPERPDEHITERGLTDAVWELMTECWNFKHPEKRPKAQCLMRRLHTLSREIQITAWGQRTKTMHVPNPLVEDIITSNAASWTTLGVKIGKGRSSITHRDTTIIKVTGYATPVAQACLQIETSIKKSPDIPVTQGRIKIPKDFRSRIIGREHCHHRHLEIKHGVRIKFPSKQSPSSDVTIEGSADAIEKAKEDLRKMLRFERNSRDVFKVSSRVAEKVSEQRENLLRSPLWDLKVEIQGDHGTVTLRGKREGIIIAQKSIQAIQEKIEQEVTADIPVDITLHDMFKSDHQAWVDIVKRCGGPPCLDSSEYPFVLDMMPDHIKVRGPPTLITSLRTEVAELIDIGHACVLAKRITASRHKALLDMQGGLIQGLRRHARAMVYFPDSGGYKDIGRPENMNCYSDNLDFRDIVKVVGRREQCEAAREYLEDLVKQQRKEQENPSYLFPAALYNFVKLKLDPMLKTLGVKEVSTVPASNYSILCLISQDKDLITASGPGWSIHKRRFDRARDDQPMCEMRLISGTGGDLSKAGGTLQRVACSLWRRIGVLVLQGASDSRLIKGELKILENQADDLFCQLVENPGPPRLVIGGPSTDAVESVINSAIALIEAAEDEFQAR